MEKFSLLPFSCVKEAILITLGGKKNLPHMYKRDKTAPDCRGTYLQVVLPVCFSPGKHRLPGDTRRAPPAQEQLLSLGHLNILSFHVVLKQFLCGGRAGGEGLGCGQHCCFGQ